MATRDRAAQEEGEHGRAVQRLKEAVTQQRRLRDEHRPARDTPAEVTVDASLIAADDQVAARERWLKSVDEHDY
jgi:hypothetical protein